MWGISFLNPAFLFGILAAGLPLLIHFLIKRKVVKIPFSFFKLLESVSQKKLQRFKLSNILLLLIRIMIIFVLSIALSKPFFRNYSGIFFSQGEGSSLVILIDNSYSMSMVDTNISRLERAKNTAKSIINLMSEHDETVIIPFSNTTTSSAYNFTSNKIELFNDIDKIKISNYTTNVSSGLKQAKRPLKKAHNSVKRIILLTDLQKSGWQSIEHGIVSPEIKLNIINVGQKDAPNLAVTKLEFHKEAIIGQITSFNAIAKNFGKESMQNKLLSLVINGQKVFNQQVSLKPHEEIKLTLYHTFAKQGIHSGYIEISDDLMSIDNRYYFILDVIDKINILSVSGKNGPTPDKNETFYLNIALNPENSSNSIFRVKEITQDELDKIEFSDFD
ncbi:MAG: VWA domain-containing protein, partial [Candidatus Firestonebacteria bacterium]|nr:VWA domain-containing protein [Candidatus Firestonebacteria bacterium]